MKKRLMMIGLVMLTMAGTVHKVVAGTGTWV